jgi:restriction endonuclease S subunit
LSVATVRMSELADGNRIDAEYYDPNHLQMRHSLTQSSFPVKSLGELSKSIINFGAYSLCNFIEFQDGGVPYLTAKEIGENSIQWNTARYISSDQHTGLLWKSQISKRQVLISMAGRLGMTCVFDEDFACNSSQDVAKITLKEGINPYYVSTFLNSEYGKLQLLGAQTGSVQHHTNLGIIKTIRVIVLPIRQQEQIALLVIRAKTAAERSASLYAQAQALLTAELGLNKFDLSDSLYSVRRASEAQAAQRIDAEYFQQKYYRLIEAIQRSGTSYRALGCLIEPIRNGFDYREFVEQGTPYVRVGDVRDGRMYLDSAVKVPVTQADVQKNVHLKTGDVLFTRKGTFGNAAVVRKGQEHVIISSEIMLLRLQKNLDFAVLPDYLALFLNSKLGYMQVERRVHGVAYYSISQPDLAKVQIVLVPLSLQERVVKLVQDSLAAESDAQRLLAEAKAEVERLIEGK